MTAKAPGREAWHLAAGAGEVCRKPLARVVAGDPIVLYRRQDGSPVALEDRCPHMVYPLSSGELKGDDIECDYHGLRFDGAGRCTHFPGQKNIPDRFVVRTYPVTEVGGSIWIWLGDPARADASLLPR